MAASPLQSWAFSKYSPGAPPGVAPYFELPEVDLDSMGLLVAGEEGLWLDAAGGVEEDLLPKGEDEDEFKLVGLDAFERTLASLFTRKATPGSSPASTDAEASPRASPLERAISETSVEVLTPTSAEPHDLHGKLSVDVAAAEAAAVAAPSATGETSSSEDPLAKQEPPRRKTWNTAPPPPRRSCDAAGETTTLVLCNIPIQCTRDGLSHKIHEMGFSGDVDFIYMPVNLKSKRGMGTATVNFRTKEAYKRFVSEFHGVDVKSLFPASHCQKKFSTSVAPTQGLEANSQKLKQSGLLMSFLAEMPEWLPQCFDERGEAVDFPACDGPSAA